MAQVVIANRLRDGIVVFLGAAGEWVEHVEACAPVDDEGAEALLEVGLQAEADREVVAPTLIEVEQRGGVLTPIKMRERIRARGPTNRTDLGKQAEA